MIRWNKKLVAIGIIVILIILLAAFSTMTHFTSQGIKAKAKNACITDADCACGKSFLTKQCAVGNIEFINKTQACSDFCLGADNSLITQCEVDHCVQVNRLEKHQ